MTTPVIEEVVRAGGALATLAGVRPLTAGDDIRQET